MEDLVISRVAKCKKTNVQMLQFTTIHHNSTQFTTIQHISTQFNTIQCILLRFRFRLQSLTGSVSSSHR